jgi:hypothetical protein
MSSEQKLNDEILEKFMKRFFGYGNWNADVWFVGMEEGGGKDIEEINCRLNSWNKRGQKHLEDVSEFHKDFDEEIWNQFSVDKSILQSTWSKLIRIFLTYKDRPSDTKDIRKYQTTQWGRISGETCII